MGGKSLTPSPIIPMPSPVNRLGASAVPFTLPDADGAPHRLEDHRGRWLLLMFHRHLA
jgi:hypothetical protein